jgi:hypothetical protein
MSATRPAKVLSGRAQERLAQIHRELSLELRQMSATENLLVGALQACDFGTQYVILRDYLARINSVLSIVTRLQAFIAKHVHEDNDAEGFTDSSLHVESRESSVESRD